MNRTRKLSVSLRTEEARWLQSTARRTHSSVSALLSEAVRRLRQQEARREFLAGLSPHERASADDVEEIRREWRRD